MCKLQEKYKCSNGHEHIRGPEDWWMGPQHQDADNYELDYEIDYTTLHRPAQFMCMKPWEDDICEQYAFPLKDAHEMFYAYLEK